MPRVLKVREFLRRMERLGIRIRPGKGSEKILYRPGGRMHTLKAHKGGDDVYPHVVKIACAKLGLDLDEFWKGL